MRRTTRRASIALGGVMAAILLASGVALAATFYGTPGDDTVYGTSGNDYADTGYGNDVIDLGYGDDDAIGGYDDDRLLGGYGVDNLVGGADADRLQGGANDDDVFGGTGDDPDVDGGSGNDRVEGGDGRDYVQGYTGVDTLVGGSGDDKILAREPTGTDAAKDTVDCGGGFDRAIADPLDAVEADCESVTRISTHNGSQMKGFFTAGGKRVDFDSHVVSGGGTLSGGKVFNKESTSVVKVSGITLSVTLNPETRTITWEGSSTVPDADDKLALRLAGAEIARFLDSPKRSTTNQNALLVRDLSHLSDAPADYRFKDRSIRYSSPTAAESAASSGASGTSASYASTGGTPGSGAALCSSTTRLGSTAPTTVYAQFSGGAYGEEGTSLLPCDSNYNYQAHDASDHAYAGYSIFSGPAAGNELGRCGPEGNEFLAGGYTKDCLDHDWCSIEHGSSSGPFNIDCGDEFDEASDDYFNASYNECVAGPVLASRGPEIFGEPRKVAAPPGGSGIPLTGDRAA